MAIQGEKAHLTEANVKEHTREKAPLTEVKGTMFKSLKIPRVNQKTQINEGQRTQWPKVSR